MPLDTIRLTKSVVITGILPASLNFVWSWSMKVGDLVQYRHPFHKAKEDKIFFVIGTLGHTWVMFACEPEVWHSTSYVEVFSECR